MYVYDVVVRIIIYYCRHLTLSFFVSVHDQILFGAGDVDYCVLLGLASFMEYSIEQGWDQSSTISSVLTVVIALLLLRIKCQQS